MVKVPKSIPNFGTTTVSYGVLGQKFYEIPFDPSTLTARKFQETSLEDFFFTR